LVEYFENEIESKEDFNRQKERKRKKEEAYFLCYVLKAWPTYERKAKKENISSSVT
jgi:hypothetical protein